MNLAAQLESSPPLHERLTAMREARNEDDVPFLCDLAAALLADREQLLAWNESARAALRKHDMLNEVEP